MKIILDALRTETYYEFLGSIQFWGGLGNSVNWSLILAPILMENGNNTNSAI